MCSIKCLLLTIIMMMSLMNSSIDASVAVMSTDRGPLLQGDPMNGVYSPPGLVSYVAS